MFRSIFSQDAFAEIDRLHRELQRTLQADPNIRGLNRGGFPPLNLGQTAASTELYAFAPGLDPANIEVNLERGVLTIAAERPSDLPKQDDNTTIHINERFAGRFRRVISLPDDVDTSKISADYHDGVLHVSLKRLESVQPRRIAVH